MDMEKESDYTFIEISNHIYIWPVKSQYMYMFILPGFTRESIMTWIVVGQKLQQLLKFTDVIVNVTSRHSYHRISKHAQDCSITHDDLTRNVSDVKQY